MEALKDHGQLRRKLRAAARGAIGELPSALFLTDPKRTPDLLAIAARLPPGWGVVYRHFGAADRYEIGDELARICRRRRLVLLVSADAPLARAIGADGLHWPEAQLARRRGRQFAIETSSAHSFRTLAQAARLGLEAALLSTVFTSASPSAAGPMGAQRFRRMARAAALPLYALGGIGAGTAGRVAQSMRANIAGWAAVETIAMAWGSAN